MQIGLTFVNQKRSRSHQTDSDKHREKPNTLAFCGRRISHKFFADGSECVHGRRTGWEVFYAIAAAT